MRVLRKRTILNIEIMFKICLGYVQNTSAMTLVEPISFAFTRILTENEIPTQSKCLDNYKEIVNLIMKAGFLRHNKLVPLIKEKLPKPYSIDGIEDVIIKYCNSNKDLNKLAKSVSENVSNCSSKNIDGSKLEKLQTDIINNVCEGTNGL